MGDEFGSVVRSDVAWNSMLGECQSSYPSSSSHPHLRLAILIFVRPSPSSSGHPHLHPAVPIFIQPSPSSSSRPHLCPAVPIFVWPSPYSSDWTTHMVRSVRPDPPDLTGLCLILFMNSCMFSFHNTMSLRQPDPFPTLQIDLQPHRVVGLLLILSHGLSYASIILLYLVLSMLLDYTLTSNLCP